ncbi:sensor histidine kinase [Shewanella sp. GD03713]|uniref:sensor histidine kinase n=1 Tax=Shewanella sp. GD03713 TaxID=2975372 RepID=UPI000B3412FC|nr:sensor histidine kinase [Shewanella sp. GD03713]MDH1468605.1 sensor histidine kinase [Shewanella sp. GD03713]QXN24798.1 sensor histidine kinase [Shewanella putrefaciens]
MYSLKAYLTRNLLITLTCAMALLLYLLFQGIQILTQDFVASRLQHDADSLISALEPQADGTWALSTDRLPNVYHRVNSGHYFAIKIGEQQLRSRSLFDHNVSLPTLKVGEEQLATQYVGHHHWLMLSQAIVKNEQTIILWVTEDISSLEQTQLRFLGFAAVVVLLTIMILLFAQHLLLKRGFKPLEQMPDAIRQLRLQGQEIDTQHTPTEISPLIEEIERLMNQLGQRVQRSRNALGNLAHEMKRPLQGLQSYLDSLAPEQRREGSKVLADLHHIIERELKRTKIVGLSTPGRFTVLNDDLPPLIQVMQRIYPERQIDYQFDKSLVMPFDRDDLLELLGNLLDNACKHARHQIKLCIEQTHVSKRAYQIEVSDDGEGVSDSDLAVITERGIRLDESIQGHGLGLSICKDIVESYQGELSFTHSELGGLKVSVLLPQPH